MVAKDASTIKQMAKLANEVKYKYEMETIDEAIEKAAKEGRFGIYINISDSWVIEQYRSEGFRVNVTVRSDGAYWLNWGGD